MLSELREFEHYVAIDGYCAWPNLTVLDDGCIGALVFNQGSHGRVEGDIELWVSRDGRPPWTRRSMVTQHPPGESRFNVAGGMGHDGTLIALVGGWLRPQRLPIRTDNLLDPLVCRSADAGYTWEVAGAMTGPPGAGKLIPFGNVRVGQDGSLYVAAYDCRMSSPAMESRLSSVYIFRSTDNGRTWGAAQLIGRDGFTETDILQAPDGHWLAAARTLNDYANPSSPHSNAWVTLWRGDRTATTWEQHNPLTLPWQHPGNLLQLQDGRILFTCGNRVRGSYGVFVRVSEDQGATWAPPLALVGDLSHVGRADLGYPSTVQLADGTLVTAYYAIGAVHHQNYHVAVFRWSTDEIEHHLASVRRDQQEYPHG